ncbi:MAG: nucleoside deaminase [Christensenellales bacterium]
MEEFMNEALRLARLAGKRGEVPIGAVVTKGEKIIARGYNCREKKQNALLHAEIVAISKACKKLHSWRLDGCTLFVTLEPCPMCAGAILNARMDKVVFGAYDAQSGFCTSNPSFLGGGVLNHKVEVVGGIKEEECKKLIQDFFRSKRK